MPFFEADDGTRLAYEDYGTGSPIVFLVLPHIGIERPARDRSRSSSATPTAACCPTGAGTAAPTAHPADMTSTPALTT